MVYSPSGATEVRLWIRMHSPDACRTSNWTSSRSIGLRAERWWVRHFAICRSRSRSSNHLRSRWRRVGHSINWSDTREAGPRPRATSPNMAATRYPSSRAHYARTGEIPPRVTSYTGHLWFEWVARVDSDSHL